MYALDFEYDNNLLSDYGFIVCDFNSSSGANVVSAGSKITFNKVSKYKGKKYNLTNTQYDECIQATFDICKNPDIFDDLKITDEEFRKIMRWLNRREFLNFKVIYEENNIEERYYNASFNVSKIKINEVLYGLQLVMETDKPFSYGKEQCFCYDFNDTTQTAILYDPSDEIGYLYPNMTITCNSNGNLSIYNEMTDSTIVINNCSEGEIITMDCDSEIISSSNTSHDIYDDFNYEFFKIGNTINNRVNKITSTLPCRIEIRYYPIIKDTP